MALRDPLYTPFAVGPGQLKLWHFDSPETLVLNDAGGSSAQAGNRAGTPSATFRPVTAAPRIAITGPRPGGRTAWLFTSALVRWAGGKPLRVRPRSPLAHLEDADVDGVIIGGGADVGPLPPGGELTELAPAPDRDRLEWDVLERAAALALPVLGICRGAQLMNGFFGGELHRDVSELYLEVDNPWTVWPKKEVQLTPEAEMQRWLPAKDFKVNSMHRHAIKTVGEGLRVAARDRANVVQAIERRDSLFWIGVQWHPEYIPQSPVHRSLFKALVERAGHRCLPS